MKKILTLGTVLLAAAAVMAGCKTTAEDPENPAKVTTETQGGESKPGVPGDDTNMVQASYPEMPPYPNEDEYFDPKTGEFDDEGFSEVFDVWWENKRNRRDLPAECIDSLRPFFASSIRQFLTEEIPGQEGDNRIYSPVNVYMALTMLAETTDGNSRQQILSLLGSESLESLRQQADQVWNANYSRDGSVTSILANSLWLDESISFKKETLENLAKYHYASSYWGRMGSPELDERLQGWLNEQTDGLLKEQASGIHMDDGTLIALASTIYYRAKWSEEFMESNTKEEVFHGADGDMTCDFMHQGGTRAYYWGDKFGAIYKGLQESGGMWLILPDEGVTPEEVLLEDQVMELILNGSSYGIGEEWKDQKRLIVNLAMPKFDVVSNLDLMRGLGKLGLSDVLDAGKADFSPLVKDAEGIFLSQASHAARVMVDEEGCIAAAYTVMAAAGASMPPEEEMDFVLDKPFIFVITSDVGMPLFAGIVNQP